MKWRAFSRTPQWVRLSEWLGLWWQPRIYACISKCSVRRSTFISENSFEIKLTSLRHFPGFQVLLIGYQFDSRNLQLIECNLGKCINGFGNEPVASFGGAAPISKTGNGFITEAI